MNEEFLASKEFLDYMRKESRKVGAANLKRVAVIQQIKHCLFRHIKTGLL